VVADEGFDGLVVEVATSGVTPDTGDRGGRLRRGHGPRGGRVRAGTSSWPPRRARLGRHRGALGDPGQRGRHSHPERRRLRPGCVPDHRLGPRVGPGR
jgi:hypothetical protein